ncbi:hypothetical protein OG696_17535 [Streptomyces sp. NBC_00656]|uniref:hypothetical protein n=1 Tax=Streptomyces sp. NBC_00656 TaxID=2903668 RepID=UPI003245A7EA
MYPRTFHGFNAKAILHGDRVEIRRQLLAKVGGAKDVSLALSDILKPLSKGPTRMVNGYVYLATDLDPDRLSYWIDAPRTRIARAQNAILFTWWQRRVQQEFVSAVEEALRTPCPRSL